MDQQLLKTDNNKTLILFFYWLKIVTTCSRFCINITHLNESEALITVMPEFFLCEGFSLGHVIITTIIMSFKMLFFNSEALEDHEKLK